MLLGIVEHTGGQRSRHFRSESSALMGNHAPPCIADEP